MVSSLIQEILPNSSHGTNPVKRLRRISSRGEIVSRQGVFIFSPLSECWETAVMILEKYPTESAMFRTTIAASA